MSTWILVANATTATLYSRSTLDQKPARIRELVHPESRMKNAELSSDRAGHMQSSGDGHGARQPRSEPKQNEAEHFARELAQVLLRGRTAGDCQKIVLVAPPAFLGLINAALDGPTAKLVTAHFEKDYTQVGEAQLATLLESG